jgi:hypothetical protein
MDMDRQDLFDALTIRLADTVGRRAVLGTLAKLALAILVFGVYPWRVLPQKATASKLVKGCRLPGQQCSGRNDCCAKKCDKDHRCGCINKGHEPLVDTPLGPTPVNALCCTNKLNKRSGVCK